MSEKSLNLRHPLQQMSRDELNVLGKRLQVANFRQLKKDELIDALLVVPTLAKQMRVTWWDLYHNHVYGVASLIGLALTVLFFLWPLANSQNIVRSAVSQHNEYGSLTLNLDRRNALQNQSLSAWIEKTRGFKDRFDSDNPPTNEELANFILEFTDFAENSFSPLQIKSFRGLESGAGGPMFENLDRVPEEMRDTFVQLCLIEYWLQHYVDLNRKNEEPVDPAKMMF